MGKIVMKLVLTGGPCAGKTTALSRLEEDLTEKGYHVVIVSESATELIKGGIKPFGDKALNMVDFQSVIATYQLSKEASYDYAVSLLPDDEECILIYDRGFMDNKAYITDDEFREMLKSMGLSELELMDQYDMVIHLVTAALGKEKYYTLENNQARHESLEEARILDKKTMQAWEGHENLIIIDNKIEFEEKIQKVINSVNRYLGKPVTIRKQKRYIVNLDKSNFDISKNFITIEQYYLKDDNCEKRIRKRTHNNEITYHLTVQKKETLELSKVMIDKKITEKEFYKLLNSYEIESQITKNRYCFTYKNQYFKLDVFDNELTLLQVDATEENPNIELPSYLGIEKEVTNDIEYQNIEMGKKQKNYILQKK